MYIAENSFLKFNECDYVDSSCKPKDEFILGFLVGDVLHLQFYFDSTFTIDLLDLQGNVILANIATLDEISEGVYKAIITIPNVSKGCYKLGFNGFLNPICSMNLSEICELTLTEICNLTASSELLACSNTIKIVSSNCYSEVVKWSNDESAFGFIYESGHYNQMRLPIELNYPQIKETSQVYRDSTGKYIKIASSIDKVFELETDYADEFFHECFAVLLAHDNIEIIGGKRADEYVKDEDYEVEWNNDKTVTLTLAKGKGNIKRKNNFNNPNY